MQRKWHPWETQDLVLKGTCVTCLKPCPLDDLWRGECLACTPPAPTITTTLRSRFGTREGSVYRLWTATGELLYIGASSVVLSRLYKQSQQKPWWREVARIDIEHFPTRAEAFRAEAEAIRTERPIHNATSPENRA